MLGKGVLWKALLIFFLMTVSVGAQQLVAPAIVINLPSRTLELYSGATLVKTYPVAIGKLSSPTPLGKFKITEKEINPVWIPPGRNGYIVPSGPNNPLGYRWMGFYPLYGIHGTNDPSSIGKVISNGCVRMQEADAEEVYELIGYRTPVTITYERIKVELDASGQASLGIYPDVYQCQAIDLAAVRRKLAAYGLDGMADQAFLTKQLGEASGRQTSFARFFSLRLRGEIIAERGVKIGDALYLPVLPLATASASSVQWNEEQQTVQSEGRSAPGKVMGDVIYVTPENFTALYGGQTTWHEAANELEIKQGIVLLNDKVLTHDIKSIDQILAIPVEQLMQALGIAHNWDAVRQVLSINNMLVPVGVIGGKPYIQITKINEFFQAYVYWDQRKNSIEIMYPSPH